MFLLTLVSKYYIKFCGFVFCLNKYYKKFFTENGRLIKNMFQRKICMKKSIQRKHKGTLYNAKAFYQLFFGKNTRFGYNSGLSTINE